MKSARLVKATRGASYSVLFQKIRAEKHDELLLLFYAPDGLRLFKFRGRLTTNACYMQKRFSAVASNAELAVAKIVAAMEDEAEPLTFIPF